MKPEPDLFRETEGCRPPRKILNIKPMNLTRQRKRRTTAFLADFSAFFENSQVDLPLFSLRPSNEKLWRPPPPGVSHPTDSTT